MKCKDCAHFSLQADIRMAQQGYGGCKQKTAGHYVGTNKNACEAFLMASKEVIAARVKFIEGNK